VCAIHRSLTCQKREEEEIDEADSLKEKGEKRKRRFFSFSQIFNWCEPMKDFLLLFFSLFPTTRN
jgi:hypothetical protein